MIKHIYNNNNNNNNKKLQDIQHNIELETPEEHLNQEIETRFDFEERCTIIKTKLLVLQNRNSPPVQPSTSQSQTNIPIQPERGPKMNFQPFQETETFRNFTKRLTVFFLLNKIEDAKIKVYILLAALSPELHERLHDLCSPEDPLNMNFEKLTKVLDDYVDPKPSIWALQHKFITRLQHEDETVATYASELKKLSLNCEFKCQNCQKSTLESFLSLQFIRGLKDSDIRTKIIQERDTSQLFTKLLDIATSIEMGKSENIKISEDLYKHSDTVHKISSSAQKLNYPRPASSRPSIIQPSASLSPSITIRDLKGRCFRCGKIDHRSNACGAIKSTCLKCKKTGHLVRVCLQRNLNTNQLDENSSNISIESTGDINLIKSEISEKYTITVKIENKNVCMEFDRSLRTRNIC
ncbi:unnamed protein product [Psylliodes chrysocephalus]|uniref:CCHC-type domain-containing protein n=1 Tax=Psylliodes chrysocephalus TaxID=3402493 RepID=A0A9P0GC07_9CUCU|nr:unnamed protein product [Psylliodes chrysocephala]